MSDDLFKKSIQKLEDEKKKLKLSSFDAMLPPSKNDLSHKEKVEKKNNLMNKFKNNLDDLNANRNQTG